MCVWPLSTVVVNMPEECTGIINLRYTEGSVGTSSNPDLYKRQNYEQLKRTSLRRGSLFVDSTFPPDRKSLGDVPGMQQWQQQQVKWMRPLVTNNKTAIVFYFVNLMTQFFFCIKSFLHFYMKLYRCTGAVHGGF